MAYSVAWVRLCTPSFERILLTCVLIVFSVLCRLWAICLLEYPWASSRSTSVSRSVSASGLSGALIACIRRAAALGVSWTCPAAAALIAWHNASAWVSFSR
jgi:hypothetical protein